MSYSYFIKAFATLYVFMVMQIKLVVAVVTVSFAAVFMAGVVSVVFGFVLAFVVR